MPATAGPAAMTCSCWSGSFAIGDVRECSPIRRPPWRWSPSTNGPAGGGSAFAGREDARLPKRPWPGRWAGRAAAALDPPAGHGAFSGIRSRGDGAAEVRGLLVAAWLLWVVPVLRLVGAVKRTWHALHRPPRIPDRPACVRGSRPAHRDRVDLVRTTWKRTSREHFLTIGERAWAALPGNACGAIRWPWRGWWCRAGGGHRPAGEHPARPHALGQPAGPGHPRPASGLQGAHAEGAPGGALHHRLFGRMLFGGSEPFSLLPYMRGP